MTDDEFKNSVVVGFVWYGEYSLHVIQIENEK